MQNDKEKTDKEREALFQRRIAELGFKHGAMPWEIAESPQFNLPFEETKYYSEFEMEAGDAHSKDEVERRVLMELVSQTYSFHNFYKRLHYELKRAQRYKRPLSVLVLGIDRLEALGDQFGAGAKDEVIKHVAKGFMAAIRDVDLPGRCREDSFGIILPETPFEGAQVAAERLRTKLENAQIKLNWQTITVTVSVGGASFPTNATLLDELFAEAAEAMLACMVKGGNAIAIGKS